MPNTLGVASFPGSLDDNISLLQAANNAATVLSAAITNSATTISVASTAGFPSVGGTLSIEGEIIYYMGKTATTFTGCARGQDDTVEAPHGTAVAVELLIVAAYHSVLSDALVAVETKLGTFDSEPVAGSVLQGTGAGTSAWSKQLGLGVAPSTARILNIAGNLSATNVQQAGAWIAPTFSSATANDLYGLHVAPVFSTVSIDSQNTIVGFNLFPTVASGATADISTINNVAISFQNNSVESPINTYRGVLIRNPTGVGSITTAVGLYISEIMKGTNNNFAIFSNGGKSYHAGAFGIGINAPNSLLHVDGPIATALVTKSTGTPYTLTDSDSVVLVHATTAFTLILPSAVGITGRCYTLKKTNTGSAVTVNTSPSQTIDGAASFALSAQWDRVTVVSDGANWLVV